MLQLASLGEGEATQLANFFPPKLSAGCIVVLFRTFQGCFGHSQQGTI